MAFELDVFSDDAFQIRSFSALPKSTTAVVIKSRPANTQSALVAEKSNSTRLTNRQAGNRRRR
jgi:hypothetical protein